MLKMPNIPTEASGRAQRAGNGHEALAVWGAVGEWLDALERQINEAPCPVDTEAGLTTAGQVLDAVNAASDAVFAYSYGLYLSGSRWGTPDRAAHEAVSLRLAGLRRDVTADHLAWKCMMFSAQPGSRWAWADALGMVTSRISRQWRHDVVRAIGRAARRWTRRDENLTVTISRYPYGPTLGGGYTTVWAACEGDLDVTRMHRGTVFWRHVLPPAAARRYRRLAREGSARDLHEALTPFRGA